MTVPTFSVPSLGNYNTSEDPKIANALQQIYDILNGNVDSANIANNSVAANDLVTAVAQTLGLNNALNTGRGASYVATEESRTNAAYGKLTTADHVQNIVLPSNGIIWVMAHLQVKEVTPNNARIALFLNNGSTDNQLKVFTPNNAAPQVQEANISLLTANTYGLVGTTQLGLLGGGYYESDLVYSSPAYTGDVTTGQVVGASLTLNYNTASPSFTQTLTPAPVPIFAAAGTYTVSLQFKSTAGVTAKERRLWAWAQGF